MIYLKCRDCGGTLNLDDDREILFCPYCGSKALLKESDAVKIERIRSKKAKDLNEQKFKYQMAKKEFERQRRKEEQENAIKYMLLLVGILLLMMIFFRLT